MAVAIKSNGSIAVEVTEHPLMEPKPVEEPYYWGDCPLDILLMVFEKLEPTDLMNCILVSGSWRDAVNYMSVHNGTWKELAQAGMVNKGIDLRRRANPGLDWRDLYINCRLWQLVKHAEVSWSYELTDADIRYLHVYKDILIMESDEDFFKKYYHIEDQLVDVSRRLIDAGEAFIDEVEETRNGAVVVNESGDVARERSQENCLAEEGEEPSYMSDKMIRMLVQEAPFTRLLVVDEDCYYMLNQENILRCAKWDATNKRWLAYFLARYFKCNKSISDISVHDDEVYMLLKTGLVFKLDKTGRNFLPDRRFNTYITPAQFEVSRMIYGEIDESIQRAGQLMIPEYGTDTKVMFHKISVVVSVPWDREFKMNVDDKTGNIVIEYPGLTCATQHGEVLFLGFMDGKVDICIARNLIRNSGRCEISANVQDCPDYAKNKEDPAIVAIEVYEDVLSHHIFVATRSNVYRLKVTYPQHVIDNLGLNKDFAFNTL